MACFVGSWCPNELAKTYSPRPIMTVPTSEMATILGWFPYCHHIQTIICGEPLRGRGHLPKFGLLNHHLFRLTAFEPPNQATASFPGMNPFSNHRLW